MKLLSFVALNIFAISAAWAMGTSNIKLKTATIGDDKITELHHSSQEQNIYYIFIQKENIKTGEISYEGEKSDLTQDEYEIYDFDPIPKEEAKNKWHELKAKLDAQQEK